MNINLYMDVYPGWDSKYAFAGATPISAKTEGSTRFKIVVSVPEWAYQSKSDGVLPVQSITEADKTP